MNRTLHSLAAAAAIAVFALAGCGGDDEESGGGGGGTEAQAPTETQGGETTPSEGGGGATTELEIPADAGGALKFDKTEATAKAGTVTLTMPNPSSVPHAIGVKGDGVDEEGETVQKDGTSEVTVDLQAGEYEFYCPVPGHEEAGMKGTLTVE